MANRLDLPQCIKNIIIDFLLPKREDAIEYKVELHKDICMHTWRSILQDQHIIKKLIQYVNVSRDAKLHEHNASPCEYGCSLVNKRLFTTRYNDASDERANCYRATNRTYFYY